MTPVSSARFGLERFHPATCKPMKAKPIQLILALLTTVTVNAKEPKPPVDRRPPPQPLLAVLDSNLDREISADEIANSSNVLSDLDKNGDGILTEKEMLPPSPKKAKAKDAANLPPPLGKRPPLLIAVLDLDEDGSLSADEIEDAPMSLLTLDKDDDGVISRKELKPKKSTDAS